MRSNDTLVDTPFQLISGFFHVNQGSEHAEQASSRSIIPGKFPGEFPLFADQPDF